MKVINLTISLLLLFIIECNAQAKLTKADSLIMADRVDIASYELYHVSMVKLLANPERYKGKHLQIEGYIVLAFESNILYLHEDDYVHGISKEGLWLTLTEKQQKKFAKYNKQYVMLEGLFDAENTGHMGLNSGSLTDIRYIAALPTYKPSN